MLQSRSIIFALLVILYCDLAFLLHNTEAITPKTSFTFSNDTSTRWVGVSQVETSALLIQMWMSQQYLYQLSVDTIAGTMKLLYAVPIPQVIQFSGIDGCDNGH
jgi:hypothetical protein